MKCKRCGKEKEFSAYIYCIDCLKAEIDKWKHKKFSKIYPSRNKRKVCKFCGFDYSLKQVSCPYCLNGQLKLRGTIIMGSGNEVPKSD